MSPQCPPRYPLATLPPSLQRHAQRRKWPPLTAPASLPIPQGRYSLPPPLRFRRRQRRRETRRQRRRRMERRQQRWRHPQALTHDRAQPSTMETTVMAVTAAQKAVAAAVAQEAVAVVVQESAAQEAAPPQAECWLPSAASTRTPLQRLPPTQQRAVEPATTWCVSRSRAPMRGARVTVTTIYDTRGGGQAGCLPVNATSAARFGFRVLRHRGASTKKQMQHVKYCRLDAAQ